MSEDPLGTLLICVASLGVVGVFMLSLFERIVPLLPSYGLFTAIGIAAAEGLYPLPAAILASVLGSGLGALAAYGVGIAASNAGLVRVRRLARRRDRWGSGVRRLFRSGSTAPFVAQLLPATRLVVPVFGGVLPNGRMRFAVATTLGLSLWNCTFIGLGYVVVAAGGTTNATTVSLALLALICLLALVGLARRAGSSSRG